MNIMSSGLKKVAGDRLESVLQKMTDSPIKGLIFGAVITIAMQSSSALTVPESVEAVPDSYYQIAHAANIHEVFMTMANAESAVMFNCTAGKDRSGVISALLLWLCGVRKSDIVYDYMRTKENNKKRFEQIRQNFPDLDMNIVIPNENNMITFMKMIEDKHGSVHDYFTSIGITPDIRQRIKEKICVA